MPRKKKNIDDNIKELLCKIDELKCKIDELRTSMPEPGLTQKELLQRYQFWTARPRKLSPNFRLPDSTVYVHMHGGGKGTDEVGEVGMCSLKDYLMGSEGLDMVLPGDMFFRMFEPVTDPCTVSRLEEIRDFLETKGLNR